MRSSLSIWSLSSISLSLPKTKHRCYPQPATRWQNRQLRAVVWGDDFVEQVTAPASPDPIAPRALVLPVETGPGVTSPIRRTISFLWVGNAVKCQPSWLSLDDFKNKCKQTFVFPLKIWKGCNPCCSCWSPSLAASILLCRICWICWSLSSSESTWPQNFRSCKFSKAWWTWWSHDMLSQNHELSLIAKVNDHILWATVFKFRCIYTI